jgi:hypothetical protein
VVREERGTDPLHERRSEQSRDATRAKALGPDLDRFAGTSLDKGAELNALTKMPRVPSRAAPTARSCHPLASEGGVQKKRPRAGGAGGAKSKTGHHPPRGHYHAITSNAVLPALARIKIAITIPRQARTG